MAPEDQDRTFASILAEALGTVATYVGGQVLVAAIMTVFYALAFWWLSLPLWFLVAPVCGAMHIVPMVGALLALGFPLLVVLISRGGWEQAAWICGVFAAAQTLEGLALSPLVHGRRLRLHPALVFLTVLVGSAVFGFAGALVAVPAVAVAVAVWRAVSSRAPVRPARR